MMWLTGNNRAFSFVELMVTVIILTVGLTFVIQGFVTAVGALNTAVNHIRVIQFQDAKMQEVEMSAKEDGGIKTGESQGEFSGGANKFEWVLAAVAVEKPEDDEEGKEVDLSEDLNEVRLKVSWQERKVLKDLVAVTYLKNKKENQ